MKNTDLRPNGPTLRTTGPDHRTTGVGTVLLSRSDRTPTATVVRSHRTGLGGQHTAPVGTSTRDDERVALFWFNRELEQYRNVADVAW